MKWLTVALIVLAAEPVFAEPNKEISLYVDADDDVKQAIGDAATQSVQAGGMTVRLVATEAELRAPSLVLRVKITDKVFVVGDLELSVEVSSGRHCDCDPSDAARLSEQAKLLVEELLVEARERSTVSKLEVVCTPKDLQLRIDRNVGLISCGTSPIRSGTYRINGSHPGFQPRSVLVTVEQGETKTVFVSLDPVKRSKTLLWLSIASGTVGLAATGIGVGNFFTSSSRFDGNRRTANEDNRRLLGGITAAVGVGALVSSYFLYRAYEAGPTVTPTADSESVGVAVRTTF